MKKRITLSQACDGLVHYKTAAGKSTYTLRNYRTTFAKLKAYLADDPQFDAITRDQLVDFFVWLREEYVSEPDGVAPRGRIKLSPKTILNVHTDLSALWTWGVEEGFVTANIVRQIDPPRVMPPIIEPFSKEEVERIVGACDRTRTWKSRQLTSSERSTADRDRALVLLLTDCGLRAAEVCSLKQADINMSNNSISILGKGNKPRLVFFGKGTAKALWKYLTPRMKDVSPEGLVFAVGPDDDLRPLTRDVLGRLLARIGERAGIPGVHPHRFRHTYAITYLRNGGDLFTLQESLGHSDLAMVKRYARIAQTDCAKAHQKASPVDNWRL